MYCYWTQCETPWYKYVAGDKFLLNNSPCTRCIIDALVNSHWQEPGSGTLLEALNHCTSLEQFLLVNSPWLTTICTILLPNVRKLYSTILIHSKHTVNGKEGERDVSPWGCVQYLFYFERNDKFCIMYSSCRKKKSNDCWYLTSAYDCDSCDSSSQMHTYLELGVFVPQ